MAAKLLTDIKGGCTGTRAPHCGDTTKWECSIGPPAKRHVQEDPFGFETDEEREVYDAVAHYIDRRFAELEHQQAGKGFVMTIYRRRAASSPVALQKSLERRATGLKAVIAQRLYDSDTVPGCRGMLRNLKSC